MSINLLISAALVCSSLAVSADAQERARLLARADLAMSTVFDVFVPRGRNPKLEVLLREQVTPGSPRYHKFLSAAEYRARFGTNPARMAEVAGALRREGFVVEDTGAHVLRVHGTAALVERVFATRLSLGVFPSGRRALVAEQALRLPPMLARDQVVVPAFAGSVSMRRHSLPTGRIVPAGREGPDGPYWVTELKQAYDLPDIRALDGRGVGIGILMAGDYDRTDIDRYFKHERIAVPAITVEDVYGGTPYSTDGSTETHLDLQQAGGMAPGAAIKLYNLPDLSDAAVLAGLADIDSENVVDIVSMSFGAAEIMYTAAYNGGQDATGFLRALDALFAQGSAQGITFVASSGDGGAFAAPPPGCLAADAAWDCGFFEMSVEHPASSPYVTAVGGTNLVTTSDPANPLDLNSAWRGENAYYDRLEYDAFFATPALGAIWGSGGGISLFEPKPAWQALAPTGSASLRAVPDVAGHMGGCIAAALRPCPPDRSGDMVAIGGQFLGVAGTSAAAPDFAGILALKAQHLQSRLGNVNAELYALGHAQRAHTGPQYFRDQSPGNDGFYPATPGYNLVLGNGTVLGRPFIGVPKAPPAGVPLSPSNP